MNYRNDNNEPGRILGAVVKVARILLANARLVVAVTFAVMVLAGTYIFLQPNKYTSTASILPSGKSDNFAALRQLAGLTGGNIDIGENSSALFPDILRSYPVRDAVADGDYTYSSGGEQIHFSFKEFFGTDKPEELRDAVDAITGISSDVQTGIITIQVTTEHRTLSQQILKKTLDELERYNNEIRRTQAKESARYLERELKTRQEELTASETRLAEFQKANQNWYSTTDPDILTELARLQRDIEINSQAYLLLREQYELARLGVQKDIPVVSLLDEPTLPTLKSGPNRRVFVFVWGLLTFLGTVIFVLLRQAYRDYSQRSGTHTLGDLGGEIARTFPVVNRLFFKRKAEYSDTTHSLTDDKRE